MIKRDFYIRMALFLLVTATLTAASASAQEGRGQVKQQYQKHKIKRVLATTTVSPKVAEKFRKDERLRRFATVEGNILTPRKGLAIAQLANGKLVITNEGNTITSYMQVIKVIGESGGIMIWVCRCPGFGDVDKDPCKFSNPANKQNPGACIGGECCDKSLIDVGDDDEEVIIY